MGIVVTAAALDRRGQLAFRLAQDDIGERPGPLLFGSWSSRRRTSEATARA